MMAVSSSAENVTPHLSNRTIMASELADSSDDDCGPLPSMELSFCGLSVANCQPPEFPSHEVTIQIGVDKNGDLEDACVSFVTHISDLASEPEVAAHSWLGAILQALRAPNRAECEKPRLEPAGTGPGAPDSTKEEFRRAYFEAGDLQARSDALPMAHYRPDCPPRVARPSESAHSDEQAPTKSCKKPPRPPKPPRHPGACSALDAAVVAAAKAAAARKRSLKAAAAKRRARMAAPQESSLIPLVALVLTLLFGLLMVFQGLFVQSSPSVIPGVGASAEVRVDASERLKGLEGLPTTEGLEVRASSGTGRAGFEARFNEALSKSLGDLESFRYSHVIRKVGAVG